MDSVWHVLFLLIEFVGNDDDKHLIVHHLSRGNIDIHVRCHHICAKASDMETEDGRLHLNGTSVIPHPQLVQFHQATQTIILGSCFF